MSTAPAVPSLPLVLRKDDHLVLARFSETDRSLTEVEASRCTGDYRECEVCFNPARPTAFAHATTTHVRYSEVVAGSGPDAWELRPLFEVEKRNASSLVFSPKGTMLVTYALMDRKSPDGNMSIFSVETGELVRRAVQTHWPGIAWSSQEEYFVRHAEGCLQVMNGDLRNGEFAATSKLELQLPQTKEIEFSMPPAGLPFLALFKPFHNQSQGTLFIYRLPNLQEGPIYQATFGRAESATVQWSASGQHIALLVKTESDKSGKSYYGTVALFLVDVQGRSMTKIKVPQEESVHDCQWNPTTNELMVVHGTMPRNKTTLYDKAGVAIMTFGEAPRNLILWAPNGRFCALGGTGNLAGDFVFFDLQPAGQGREAVAASGKPLARTTGEFNEKSSVQTWAPDAHVFLCATVFTRLRIDNKLVFFKKNGERLLTQKYAMLYGAHFVRTREAGDYPVRPASPRRASDEPAKPQAYRPPGGTSAAAAMLRRPDSSAPTRAKPPGPVGSTLVVQKKKKKR